MVSMTWADDGPVHHFSEVKIPIFTQTIELTKRVSIEYLEFSKV